jgi:hypothetical protein
LLKVESGLAGCGEVGCMMILFLLSHIQLHDHLHLYWVGYVVERSLHAPLPMYPTHLYLIRSSVGGEVIVRDHKISLTIKDGMYSHSNKSNRSHSVMCYIYPILCVL